MELLLPSAQFHRCSRRVRSREVETSRRLIAAAPPDPYSDDRPRGCTPTIAVTARAEVAAAPPGTNTAVLGRRWIR